MEGVDRPLAKTKKGRRRQQQQQVSEETKADNVAKHAQKKDSIDDILAAMGGSARCLVEPEPDDGKPGASRATLHKQDMRQRETEGAMRDSCRMSC